MKREISVLETKLNEAASDLSKVTHKKMFGCHALFADGNVFALVWKHGQIGVKLTNEQDYGELISMKGAGPWKAGPMKMAHWVLVPETIQNNQSKLSNWVRLAHAQALVSPKKLTAKKKKSSMKKVTKKVSGKS